MSDPTTKLSERLRALSHAWAEVLEETRHRTLPGEVDTFTDILTECIALADAPPVSEPVAWMQPSGPVISGVIYRRWSGATGSEKWLLAKKYTIPLFAHPTKE